MICTTHALHTGDARDLSFLEDGTVQLVVTSPPYPLVQMWDAAFAALCPDTPGQLAAGDGCGRVAARARRLGEL